jgi:diguanylate cyclase (GGDEF)-like protein/PAS domain S-box-containing protein
MEQDENFYKRILENLFDGVYFVDRRRRITYWNKGAERISGFKPGEVLGRSCADNLLMHVDNAGTVLCSSGCPLRATMQDGEVREVEVFLHHAEGHRVPVVVRATPMRDEQGEIVGAVETFSDNSNMIEALKRVDQLNQEAHQDPLTGIGNRRYIEMKIKTSLAEFNQNYQPFGLLMLDIDRFKRVNDKFGHDVGDQVLKMIASTIEKNIRTTDHIGRWGGEEFLVLVHNLDLNHLHWISDKLRALVASSYLPVSGKLVQVTVSVGATLVKPADTLATLVKRADRLLYRSKAEGRDRVTGDL